MNISKHLDPSTLAGRTGLLLVVVLVVLHCWEWGVILAGRQDATITAVVRGVVDEYPVILLWVGIVIGHLFWGRKG
jgi:hypothetical protein